MEKHEDGGIPGIATVSPSRHMPPEWAPHEATWMGFPRDSYKDSGLTREAAQRAWARVANHISDYEPCADALPFR